MDSRVHCACLVGAVLALSPLAAQQNQAEQRGFASDKAYHSADIDTVNLFNGGLTIAVPIGQRYSVGGDLSYGLTLVYGGKNWKYHKELFSDCEDPPCQEMEMMTRGVPDGLFNAGFGWMLNPGLLIPPDPGASQPTTSYWDRTLWRYVGPDAAQHYFWDELHEEDADGSATTRYSRDNTYLRLKEVSPTLNTVEFPDGIVHEFTEFDEVWRVTRMLDPFGNSVTIGYTDSTWTISDSAGRSHTISLTKYDNMVPYGISKGYMVTQIDLAAAHGNRALYNLYYQERDVGEGCQSDVFSDTFSVQLLTKVTMPAAPPYEMLTTSGDPRYSLNCLSNGESGAIEGVRLPTRGQVEWTYGVWDMTQNNERTWGQMTPWPQTITLGVIERRTLKADGTLIGTWQYENELWPFNDVGPDDKLRETRTYVKYPTGTCSTRFYDANPGYLQGTPVQPDPGWAFGLPFSRESPQDEGRFLSATEHTSTAGVIRPFNDRFECAGAVLRESYVTYEHDTLPPLPFASWTATAYQPWHDSNRRLKETATKYVDDNDNKRVAIYSDFDGFGNYRQTTTQSTFRTGQYSGDTRTVVTNYNQHATNTYPSNWTTYPIGEPWLFGVFDAVTVNDPNAYGDNDHKTTYLFDQATGFLNSRRTYASGLTSGSLDQIVDFQQDGNGNVSSETWRCDGGCSQQYVLEHEYAYGSLKRSYYQGMPFNAYEADIDANSGLPLNTYDVSGMETGYTYDLLGRITDVDEEEGALHTYGWVAASGNTPAKVSVAHENNNGSFTYYQEEFEYGPFGRLEKERREMPTGWQERSTEYNARGWKLSVSEWGSSKKTEFKDFDVFGRPQTITQPDGQDILLNYTGDSYVERQVQVATSSNGTEPASIKEHYDGFGRVWKVLEPSNPNGSDLAAEYDYDIGGRLGKVEHGVQVREFDYDGRGFLLREKHPEKDNNWVIYSDHDARGHAHRKQDGPNDLIFEYDAAERLTEIRDGNNPSMRLLKEFFYDDTATYSALGKLWKSIRHNWISLPWNGTEQDAKVTQWITYDGIQGRASKLRTRISRGAIDWTTDYTYDDLGNVTSIVYPDCTSGCAPGSGPGEPFPVPLTISHTRDKGLLTRIQSVGKGAQDLVSAITYHPNGMWSTIAHASQVTDTQTLYHDSRRPESIQAASPYGNVLLTGNYQYDGAGNISQIGSQDFIYDKVSRLTMGQVQSQGEIYEESLTYDTYGNITQRDYLPPGGPPSTYLFATDPNTNRLYSGTYDDAGSLTSSGVGSEAFVYDLLGMPWKRNGGDQTYLYDANDERVAVIQKGPNGGGYNPRTETYSARGLDGLVLRQFEHTSTGPTKVHWKRDDVFRDAIPVGFFGSADFVLGNAVVCCQPTYFSAHVDHLGSVRRTSRYIWYPYDILPTIEVEEKDFLPFGREVTSGSEWSFSLGFTGHERDQHDPMVDSDDWDYMHARYYSPWMGRFGSVDPVLKLRKAIYRPQRWHRYSYATNNPLKYVDPTGQFIIAHTATSAAEAQDQLGALQNVFIALGENEAAEALKIEETDRGFEVTSGDMDLSKSDNHIVRLFGEAIKSGVEVGFAITSRDLSQYSGAVTDPTGFDPNRSDDHNRIEILINPSQVANARVPTFWPDRTTNVPLNAAVVHEFGHAHGYFRGRANPADRIPMLPSLTNDWAVMWENQYRSQMQLPLRTDH